MLGRALRDAVAAAVQQLCRCAVCVRCASRLWCRGTTTAAPVTRCHQCAGQQLVATAPFFGIFRLFCWETCERDQVVEGRTERENETNSWKSLRLASAVLLLSSPAWQRARVCAGAAVTTAVPCWGWSHSAMELGLHLVTAIHPLAQVLLPLCRNAELP